MQTNGSMVSKIEKKITADNVNSDWAELRRKEKAKYGDVFKGLTEPDFTLNVNIWENWLEVQDQDAREKLKQPGGVRLQDLGHNLQALENGAIVGKLLLLKYESNGQSQQTQKTQQITVINGVKHDQNNASASALKKN